MRLIPFILLILTLNSNAQNPFPPVGLWRELLSYLSAADVTGNDKKIYCATPYSLFTFDLTSKEINRISKVSGLSETGVSTINYNPYINNLLIAYANSNIDILDQAGIHNIPELKRLSVSGNKTIYNIYPDNTFYYLATGLGIILVDGVKMEIKDSWFIGQGGNYVKTNGVTKVGNILYAATEEGLKKIDLANDPANADNWQTVGPSSGLNSLSCRMVINLNNKALALENDSVFIENGSNWNLFFSNGWPIVSINASENKLIICERTQAGDSKVIILKDNGDIIQTIQQPSIISYPNKGISKNNDYWIADLYGGLSHWSGNNYEQYKLNSPEDVATGEMTVYNNSFYATAGSVNDSWNYQYNRNGLYKFSNGVWTNYNQFHFNGLDSMMDFISVAVDPRDETPWAGSFGGGLLHIKKNDQLEIFKQQSPIEQAIGDPGSYRVSGLTFDQNNNLWVANFGADHEIHVLKNDNTWQSFVIPFFIVSNSVSQIIIDDLDQKWIVSPNNGLIVFNHGQSIDDKSDDKWKLYASGINNGNLPSSDVLSITKDKNGFIWVGTSDGIGVIQCPESSLTTGCNAIWPVTQETSFANYLFKGQAVRSMAVDGENRKWVATSNGAWLISAEGDKVIEHFTEDNSALLSSDIKKITINGFTGEVFFATSKGICSYRSTATEASETNGHVLVFPNPVPADFTGSIAIRGLPENSYFKIIETNGRLVYQSTSHGGQAIWNGKDYRGIKVSSGIYLVIAEDDMKQQKVITKIVFISK
ncbi:MAG: two-component regulator propeller domain-containing protein [Flavisolibacter sp.]